MEISGQTFRARMAKSIIQGLAAIAKCYDIHRSGAAESKSGVSKKHTAEQKKCQQPELNLG